MARVVADESECAKYSEVTDGLVSPAGEAAEKAMAKISLALSERVGNVSKARSEACWAPVVSGNEREKAGTKRERRRDSVLGVRERSPWPVRRPFAQRFSNLSDILHLRAWPLGRALEGCQQRPEVGVHFDGAYRRMPSSPVRRENNRPTRRNPTVRLLIAENCFAMEIIVDFLFFLIVAI